MKSQLRSHAPAVKRVFDYQTYPHTELRTCLVLKFISSNKNCIHGDCRNYDGALTFKYIFGRGGYYAAALSPSLFLESSCPGAPRAYATQDLAYISTIASNLNISADHNSHSGRLLSEKRRCVVWSLPYCYYGQPTIAHKYICKAGGREEQKEERETSARPFLFIATAHSLSTNCLSSCCFFTGYVHALCVMR